MLRVNHGMIASLVLTLLGVGCGQPGGDFKTAKQIKDEKQAAGHVDDHDHGAGPHGGAIVELGDDEYHAEVVVDGKTHSLVVYLLGKDAKTAAPVASTEVTVVAEDQTKHTLKAAPQEGDGEGKASKFELIDETVVDGLTKAGYLHGSLQLQVDGKPYRGDIDAHFDGGSHDDHKDEPKSAETPKNDEAPTGDEAKAKPE